MVIHEVEFKEFNAKEKLAGKIINEENIYEIIFNRS